MLSGPVHPFALGVTVTVAVTLVLPVFVALKASMSPVPATAKPMDTSELTHEYVVPETLLPKSTSVVGAPLQTN